MDMRKRATELYATQEFKITDMVGRLVDGVCQFEYRGYQISASSVGLTTGGCPHQVAIFSGEDRAKLATEVDTIEYAIEWVNEQYTGLN